MLKYMNEFVLTIHQMRFLEILAMITVNDRDIIRVEEVIELYYLVQENFIFLDSRFLKRF